MVIFAVMAALCIGILIGMHLFQDRPVGDLRVDHSDPVDGPASISGTGYGRIRNSPQKDGLRSGSKPRLHPARITPAIMEPTLNFSKGDKAYGRDSKL